MPKRTGIPFSCGDMLTDISEFDKLYQLEHINKNTALSRSESTGQTSETAAFILLAGEENPDEYI